MKKAIVFDVDGTLWDAVFRLKESYDFTMKRLNEPIIYSLNDIKDMMGLTPNEFTTKFKNDSQSKNANNLFLEFSKDELEYLKKHSGKIYEGVNETFEALHKQFDLYILSNSEKGYVENFLKHAKLKKYIKGYLQAGDTGLTKAENILLIKNKNKIDKLIYVGDTLKDFNECKKANVDFVHAAYGFGKVDNPKYKIDKITDLISLSKKF